MSGHNRNSDMYGLLQDIVRDETKWLRHYPAKVINVSDPMNKKRIQVAIEELGWTDGKMGLWAFPRDMHAQITPVVDEWVEIHFVSGNPARPVYMGLAWEHMQDTQTPNYISENSQVLFQDPKVANNAVVYDMQTQKLEIPKYLEMALKEQKLTLKDTAEFDLKGKTVTLLKGTEAFVLGNAFDTFLDLLMTWLGAHVHICSAPTVASSSPTVPAPTKPTILSTSIKGK